MTTYAEGPTLEVYALVDAPVETVWELVSDIDLPARFSTEFLGGQWLDDTPGAGARFTGRNRHGAIGEWETTSYLSRYEPPLVFAWDVSDPQHPSSSWWYVLDQIGGAVRVRHGVRIGPAPSGLTFAITAMPEQEERIVAHRLREFERNMTATLLGIKALAEARP